MWEESCWEESCWEESRWEEFRWEESRWEEFRWEEFHDYHLEKIAKIASTFIDLTYFINKKSWLFQDVLQIKVTTLYLSNLIV